MSVGFQSVVTPTDDRPHWIDPTLVLRSQKRARVMLRQIVPINLGILNVSGRLRLHPGSKPLRLAIQIFD
jgi:hypothetical protein